MKNPFSALMPQSQMNKREIEVTREQNTKFTSFSEEGKKFPKKWKYIDKRE